MLIKLNQSFQWLQEIMFQPLLVWTFCLNLKEFFYCFLNGCFKIFVNAVWRTDTKEGQWDRIWGLKEKSACGPGRNPGCQEASWPLELEVVTDHIWYNLSYSTGRENNVTYQLVSFGTFGSFTQASLSIL